MEHTSDQVAEGKLTGELSYLERSAKYTELALPGGKIDYYDANNATGNLLNSAWQSQIHAELRQPLLQGGGMQFNRIAGPGSIPGVYGGVLIAKVNNDITSANLAYNNRQALSSILD